MSIKNKQTETELYEGWVEMNFNDFFDVYNVKHLAAYRHLTKTGIWPEGFIPVDCVMPNLWISHIQAKMAYAYVDFALSGKIIDMPVYEI